MISLIVAAAENDVIGRGGKLPWKLADDLQHFKAVTMGKPVIMGRKTWESLGRPLPGRHNIVITRQAGFAAAGCTVVASPEAAVDAAVGAAEVMVIGGEEIFLHFLPIAGRIYLTRVHAAVSGDARLPPIDWSRWVAGAVVERRADERNEFDWTCSTWERR